MTLHAIFASNDASFFDRCLSIVLKEKDLSYRFFQNDLEQVVNYCNQNHVDFAFLSYPEDELLVRMASELRNNFDNIQIFLIVTPTQKNHIQAQHNDPKIVIVDQDFNHDVFENCLTPFKKEKANVVTFKTFGPFDCFVNGERVHFVSRKSKELLALMVANPNSTLEMEYVMSALWPDHDFALAKRLYRDAVIKLRKVLNEQGIADICKFYRGCSVLTPRDATCDYWSYLKGEGDDFYWGEFLPSYEWSLPLQMKLDEIKARRSKRGD